MIDRPHVFPGKVNGEGQRKPLGCKCITDPQVQLILVLVSELPRRAATGSLGQWDSLHVTYEFAETL